MPLGLVDFQYLPRLQVQTPVELRQTLRNVLMYSGFADIEFFRGGADCRPILNDVQGETFRPFFHIPFQKRNTPRAFFPILCAGTGKYNGKAESAPDAGKIFLTERLQMRNPH